MSNLHRPRVQLYNNRILNYFLDKKQAVNIDKSQLSHLKAIMNNSKGLNDFHTAYNFKTEKHEKDCTIAKLGYGRIYGNIGSMEYLDYNYRDNLYGDFYHDIDIKNCHPVLLIQLAKTKGIALKNLELYVENREENLKLIGEYYKEQGQILTRDDCKTMIITVIYGAKIPAFKALHNELLALTLLLKDEHSNLWDAVSAQKQKNKEGAFLSFIAQTEERKCLDTLDAYFYAQGRSVDGLAYDGLQVRKTEPNETFPTDLLVCAKQFTKEKTGYDIGLEIKPMVKTIDDSLLSSKDEKEQVTYDTLKLKFEENHFYFVQSDTYCEVVDSKINHYKDSHAKTYFNTWIIGDDKNGVPNPFFPKWVKDPKRRMIHRLVYKKIEDCTSEEYPLFTGFKFQSLTAQPSDEERKIYEEHFKDLLMCACGDEEAVMIHVLKSFAHMIQKPFEKSNTMTVFASPTQGTGKDTVLSIIQNIVGDNYTAHYTNTDIFWDKHDDLAVGKGFVYLEEFCCTMDKAKQSLLKARITGLTLSINPKGIKGYNCPNMGHHYATLNGTMKIDSNDRRINLVTPSDRNKYIDWDKVYELIKKEEYTVSIANLLENIDINGYNPSHYPETADKKAIKELSISSEEIFLKQWVKDDWVSATTMYEEYALFCTENHMSHALNVKSFGLKLIYHKSLYEKRTTKTGVQYKNKPIVE